jgi:hypothetical protein
VAVYVDDMEAPFGRMVMCHMIADTRAELDAMATRIGVAVKWRQQSGTHGEHFDICKTKRRKAIEFGAVPITLRALAQKTIDRRAADALARYLSGPQPLPFEGTTTKE